MENSKQQQYLRACFRRTKKSYISNIETLIASLTLYVKRAEKNDYCLPPLDGSLPSQIKANYIQLKQLDHLISRFHDMEFVSQRLPNKGVIDEQQ